MSAWKVGQFVFKRGYGTVGVIRGLSADAAVVQYGSHPSDRDRVALADLESCEGEGWQVDSKGNITRKEEVL